MTLPLPNLDDHTFADIVADARSRIPVECPEWTDQNPSDIGIILIELLAWLTEMTIYRLNQVTDQNYVAFLNLLSEEDNLLSLPISHDKLQDNIRSILLNLQKPYRTVTVNDYEQIITVDWNNELKKTNNEPKKPSDPDLTTWPKDQASNNLAIQRVNCIPQFKPGPNTNPQSTSPSSQQNTAIIQLQPTQTAQSGVPTQLGVLPTASSSNATATNNTVTLSPANGHITIVVVREMGNQLGQSSSYDYAPLLNFLNKRKLLTTQVHIIDYQPVNVKIDVSLVIENGTVPATLRDKVLQQMKYFFAPFNSGDFWNGQGWPFGRDIYISELYRLLSNLPGVDYVNDLKINGQSTVVDGSGENAKITIENYQLVNFQPEQRTITLNTKARNGTITKITNF